MVVGSVRDGATGFPTEDTFLRDVHDSAVGLNLGTAISPPGNTPVDPSPRLNCYELLELLFSIWVFEASDGAGRSSSAAGGAGGVSCVQAGTSSPRGNTQSGTQLSTFSRLDVPDVADEVDLWASSSTPM